MMSVLVFPELDVNVISSADYSLGVEHSSLNALCPLDGRDSTKVKWLLKLSQVSEVPSFSIEAKSYLQNLLDQFNMDDALEVKRIEEVTNYEDLLLFLVWLNYALMLKEALNLVLLPAMDELIEAICNMATANASIPMLSRTHGQVVGVGFGHSLIAYKGALQGIRKLQVNHASLIADLDEHGRCLPNQFKLYVVTLV
ncbi:hypothetical protein DH2020_014585 [Rehmannia glutinosa]|uniref:Fumarate lyase N-terminal domain-containing protein n=1 Tax=Rehmannia glutinosa TaxID=99300 RepID=A0ABR0X0S7_REHGL